MRMEREEFFERGRLAGIQEEKQHSDTEKQRADAKIQALQEEIERLKKELRKITS
jgi:hypothetical protein